MMSIFLEDLSACSLVSFPDAVYLLLRDTVVLHCDLSENGLKKIPPKLARKFTGITRLNLAYNKYEFFSTQNQRNVISQ